MEQRVVKEVGKKSNKNRRKQYIFYCIIIGLAMFGFIFGELHSNRIRASGLRTIATVTEVEIRDIEGNDDEVRHHITFEYEVDGQTISTVRSRTYNRSIRPQRVVGEQVEIYYDERNPANFVLASERDGFGITFWIAMIVFSSVLGILIYKIKVDK